MAVVLLVADTVRYMPPLAFGIPMNNIVKYGFIVDGLLLSYGDYDKRALSLLKDSRQGSQRGLRPGEYGVTQPVGYHV